MQLNIREVHLYVPFQEAALQDSVGEETQALIEQWKHGLSQQVDTIYPKGQDTTMHDLHFQAEVYGHAQHLYRPEKMADYL